MNPIPTNILYGSLCLSLLLSFLNFSSALSLNELLYPDPNNFQLVSHQYSRGDSTKNWNNWRGRDIQLTNLAETVNFPTVFIISSTTMALICSHLKHPWFFLATMLFMSSTRFYVVPVKNRNLPSGSEPFHLKRLFSQKISQVQNGVNVAQLFLTWNVLKFHFSTTVQNPNPGVVNSIGTFSLRAC